MRASRIAVVAIVVLSSCGPKAAGERTDALVTKQGDGFRIEIAVCSDGGLRFVVFADDGRVVDTGKSHEPSDSTRLVELTVTSETLASLSFGEGLKVVDTVGRVSSPDEVTDVRLSTSLGEAFFDPRKIDFAESSTWLIHGPSVAPADGVSAESLLAHCG